MAGGKSPLVSVTGKMPIAGREGNRGALLESRFNDQSWFS